MNEETENFIGVEQEERAIGPGPMLREARERVGISPSDLAQQFHLNAKIVNALEANDLDALPSKVFIRGYLASFARVLEIDPDRLLEQFDAWAGHKPEAKTVVANAVFRTEKSRGDLLVRRWGTWAIAAILIVLSLVWWQGEIALRFLGNGEEVKVEQQLKPIQPQKDVVEEAVDRQGEVEIETPQRLSLEQSTETPPLPVVTAAVGATQASDRLVVRADADSWVEVVDASGARLVYDLLKAGSSRDVAGEPPFVVSLGYAPGVSLEFNGEPVKFRRVATDGTTRVRVGTLTNRQSESG